MKWLYREMPARLKPAKGIINGLILGIIIWIIIALILIFDSCSVHAGIMRADWTKVDTALLVTGTTLHIMDWGQTLEVARNPKEYGEKNPILGRHPSVGKVNAIGLGTLAIQTIIPVVIPKKYRWYWWGLYIGTKGYCVTNNFNIGLKVKF